MTERFFIPTGPGEAEQVEKRSRFLGHVWYVKTEEEAKACILAMKKRYHDARHNCWCYRLREGGVERYSDDGEPQGTAGQPMLNVFQREEVENVCCVVTRYFGGILLGAGGLVRAYTQSAKDALDAAGISVLCRWTEMILTIPYALLERVRLELEKAGGVAEDTQYAGEVTLKIFLPSECANSFSAEITELSAGTVFPVISGEDFRSVPKNKK